MNILSVVWKLPSPPVYKYYGHYILNINCLVLLKMLTINTCLQILWSLYIASILFNITKIANNIPN